MNYWTEIKSNNLVALSGLKKKGLILEGLNIEDVFSIVENNPKYSEEKKIMFELIDSHRLKSKTYYVYITYLKDELQKLGIKY